MRPEREDREQDRPPILAISGAGVGPCPLL